ncbi:MAG: vWA domain-containing protein, partial [Polyangiales bacterium]
LDTGGGGGPSGLGGDATPGDATRIDPDAACLTTQTAAKSTPADLLFQLDVSGSMNCPASDSSSASCAASASSRWSVFRTELKKALSALPDHNSAGVMHYPTGTGLFSGDPTGCVPGKPDVPLGLLSSTRATIAAALDGRTPAGGTPTHDAVKVALAALAATKSDGNRFLVLATDGNATFCSGCDISCNSAALATDSEAMIKEVEDAAKAGVRTFVIGVPGSQGFRTVLSRMAEAGGTKAKADCSSAGPSYCHWDMTTTTDFGAALKDVLAKIGGAALSCEYPLPPKDGSFDPTKVNVRLATGGSTTDLPRDPSHKDGWDYSADGNTVILYGPACEQAKSASDGSVTLLFGCPTIIK